MTTLNSLNFSMLRQTLEETKIKRKQYGKNLRRSQTASNVSAKNSDLLIAIKNSTKLKIQNETLTVQLKNLLIKNESLVKCFYDYKKKSEKELENLRDELRNSLKNFDTAENSQNIKKEIKELKHTQERLKQKCFFMELKHVSQIKSVVDTVKTIQDNYAFFLEKNKQMCFEVDKCKNKLAAAFNLISDLNVALLLRSNAQKSKTSDTRTSREIFGNENINANISAVIEGKLPSVTSMSVTKSTPRRQKRKNPLSNFLNKFNASINVHPNNEKEKNVPILNIAESIVSLTDSISRLANSCLPSNDFTTNRSKNEEPKNRTNNIFTTASNNSDFSNSDKNTELHDEILLADAFYMTVPSSEIEVNN